MRAYFALYNQRPGLSSRPQEATGLAARRRQSRVLRPAVGPARTPAALMRPVLGGPPRA